MAKSQKNSVFQLIKTLTKSEKRQFKLYVGRLDVNIDSKFIQLFDFLDKSKVYNEEEILESAIVKKSQLANVKSHLYKQILISLKSNPTNQSIKYQIREQLDFASILYDKGLYNQSLKILEKAKDVALQNEEKNLAFEIIELEKIIETQYITRSIKTRADALALQAKKLSALNVITSKLTNLSLQLYSIILKSGYVKNEAESNQVTDYFIKRLPVVKIHQLGFREKLWYYKAHLWYSFLVQDFLNCYRYALKWVNLFDEYPKMLGLNPVFYLKGVNYLLEALFLTKNGDKFKLALENLKARILEANFPKNGNVETLTFLYINFHNINYHFIDGNFKKGIELIPFIENELVKFDSKIDAHHKMIFYYKFACLNFGVGNYEECINFLDRIISNKTLEMREDLLCFSRLLNVIAHYESGLDYHLDKLLVSTYKFLVKMNEMSVVQQEIIKFIRGLQDIYPQDIKKAFRTLHNELKLYENHPYERRAFLYLDIISWLESKITNMSVAEIINSKINKH